MTELIPLDPLVSPVNTGKYRHGDSNPGTNPSSGLRNFVLCQPTERLTCRTPLPVIRLPHEWHEDKFRRPACVRPAPNKGKKYPATPVFGDDARRILDALFTPGVDDVGKWAKRWGHHKLRNRTVMEVAMGTGMRIHEILLLRPSDLDPKARQVVVRRGKGGKRRLIAILPTALEAVYRWLVVWDRCGFKGDDLLFPVLEGPTKGGLLEQAYIRDQLHRAAKKAGVSVRAAPHQWRHGLAVELHRRKVPIGLIQRQLGHSSPATTGIYLAGISAEEVIDAVVAAFQQPIPSPPLPDRWTNPPRPPETIEQALARIAELEAQLAKGSS